MGSITPSPPYPVSNKDFSKTLGRVLHRPALLPVPTVAIKLLMGEMATIVLDSQKILPARLNHQGHTFLYPQLEQALKHILKGK